MDDGGEETIEEQLARRAQMRREQAAEEVCVCVCVCVRSVLWREMERGVCVRGVLWREWSEVWAAMVTGGRVGLFLWRMID